MLQMYEENIDIMTISRLPLIGLKWRLYYYSKFWFSDTLGGLSSQYTADNKDFLSTGVINETSQSSGRKEDKVTFKSINI